MDPQIDSQTISIVLACLGPLLTLLVYQWTSGRKTRKVLDQMSVLLYDHDVLKKLFIHITMDNPVAAAEERSRLEKRIEKLETVFRLLCSRNRIEESIIKEIRALGES